MLLMTLSLQSVGIKDVANMICYRYDETNQGREITSVVFMEYFPIKWVKFAN